MSTAGAASDAWISCCRGVRSLRCDGRRDSMVKVPQLAQLMRPPTAIEACLYARGALALVAWQRRSGACRKLPISLPFTIQVRLQRIRSACSGTTCSRCRTSASRRSARMHTATEECTPSCVHAQPTPAQQRLSPARAADQPRDAAHRPGGAGPAHKGRVPVSYTHLTLPTTAIV